MLYQTTSDAIDVHAWLTHSRSTNKRAKRQLIETVNRRISGDLPRPQYQDADSDGINARKELRDLIFGRRKENSEATVPAGGMQGRHAAGFRDRAADRAAPWQVLMLVLACWRGWSCVSAYLLWKFMF